MMRKTIIALFALAAVGLVQPTVASARGGGGGGGHGGGGGGFHGGGGGGWHGGGGWGGGGMRAAAIGGGGGMRAAAIGGGGGIRPAMAPMRVAAIGAGAGFGHFHHGFRHGFHRRVFFVGAGPYAYYDYPYYYDDSYYSDDTSCYIVRQRVLTRHGWRVRPVQVCG